MTTNINLFVSEEIMEEDGPWPRQGSSLGICNALVSRPGM